MLHSAVTEAVEQVEYAKVLCVHERILSAQWAYKRTKKESLCVHTRTMYVQPLIRNTVRVRFGTSHVRFDAYSYNATIAVRFETYM